MGTTYADALRWLYGFADLERGTGLHSDAPPECGLSRVRRLLRQLRDPHLGHSYVHVAGSKGKGSVCALVATAAEAAGLRTGLYTQPHLHTFRERFQIDGEIIPPRPFADLVDRVRPAVGAVHAEAPSEGTLTTFEIATAMALLWFAEEDVDLAVIEVGLGGRLDATNVITPQATAVTTLSLEHTSLLGDSLEQIAREKAAIAKAGVPLIVARQPDAVLSVVRRTAEAAGARVLVAEPLGQRGQTVWQYGRPVMLAAAPNGGDALPIGLVGSHQLLNASVAIGLCRALAGGGLTIPCDAIRAGFSAARWPARLEVVEREPLTVVDGAHTPESVAAAVRAMREFLDVKRGPVIFGAYRDKRVPEMVAELSGFASHLVLLRPKHPRGWTPERMLRRYPQIGNAAIADGPADALARARAAWRPGQAILACGSLGVAGDVRASAGVPCELDPDLAPKG